MQRRMQGSGRAIDNLVQRNVPPSSATYVSPTRLRAIRRFLVPRAVCGPADSVPCSGDSEEEILEIPSPSLQQKDNLLANQALSAWLKSPPSNPSPTSHHPTPPFQKTGAPSVALPGCARAPSRDRGQVRGFWGRPGHSLVREQRRPRGRDCPPQVRTGTVFACPLYCMRLFRSPEAAASISRSHFDPSRTQVSLWCHVSRRGFHVPARVPNYNPTHSILFWRSFSLGSCSRCRSHSLAHVRSDELTHPPSTGGRLSGFCRRSPCSAPRSTASTPSLAT